MPPGTTFVIGLVLLGLLAIGSLLAYVYNLRSRLRAAPSRLTARHLEPRETATEISAVAPRPPPLPIKLYLGDDPAFPEVAIERCPALLSQNLIKIPADRQLIERLAPLLQHAPGLAITAAVAGAPDLFVLSFSPIVTEGLTSGSYDLARSAEGGFRALALGDGGIVGHGTLHPVTALQASAAALAVWQVLSVLVAQQHLSKINDHLERLSAEVADIRQYLENSRWGGLAGKCSYLKQLFQQLQGYMPSKDEALAFRHQVETIERETLENLHAIDADLDVFVSTIAGTQMVSRWGTDKDTLLLGERIERLSALLKQRHLAIHTRGIAAQLLACLPGSQHFANERISHIAHDLVSETFLAQGSQAFVTLIDEKIQSRVSAANAADHRKQLKSQLEVAETSLYEHAQTIGRGLKDLRAILDAQLERQQKGMQLVATIDPTGRVTQLYHPA